MAKKCDACGEKIGIFRRGYATQDGVVCDYCVDKVLEKHGDINLTLEELDTWRGYIEWGMKHSTVSQYKQGVEKAFEKFTSEALVNFDYDPEIRLFKPTYTACEEAFFDDEGKVLKATDQRQSVYRDSDYSLIPYGKIIGYELLEDGGSIASGGLGRAAVGAVLLGPVGAVVGGVTGKKKSKATCTNLQVKIILTESPQPAFYITLLKKETKKSSSSYKSRFEDAQNICAKLETILHSKDAAPAFTESASQAVAQIDDPVEELRRFKALLDDGIITQEDFDTKKRQLLGL